MCLRMWVLVWRSGDNLMGLFSPFTSWILGIELRSSVMPTNAFPADWSHWPILTISDKYLFDDFHLHYLYNQFPLLLNCSFFLTSLPSLFIFETRTFRVALAVLELIVWARQASHLLLLPPELASKAVTPYPTSLLFSHLFFLLFWWPTEFNKGCWHECVCVLGVCVGCYLMEHRQLISAHWRKVTPPSPVTISWPQCFREESLISVVEELS